MSEAEEVPVKRSLSEMVTNFFYGKGGRRAKWFAAAGSVLAGAASGLPPVGITLMAGANALLAEFTNRKMFTGKAIPA